MGHEDSGGGRPGTISPASAHALSALVDIAPGGIVSRTLAQGPSGGLTLFAFDAGQALSEHTAPFEAYVLVLAGVLDLRIAGQAVTAREGEIVLMPAGAPHALTARTQAKMLLTMFRAGKA